VNQTWIYISSELTQVSDPSDEVSEMSCIPESALATQLNHYD